MKIQRTSKTLRLAFALLGVVSAICYTPLALAQPAFIYGNNAGGGPDVVQKFDKATGVLLQSYAPSGGNGRGVVVVGNVIYSTQVSDSNIYKTDATTGASLGTIPTTLATRPRR